MVVPQQYLAIIQKHLNAQVSVIFKDGKTIRLVIGTLMNMNNDKILVSNPSSAEGKVIVPFFENGSKKIFGIYNSNFVNLLNPTKNETLAQKLKQREKSTKIIATIKPYLKKIVTVLYRKTDKLLILNGEFSNMGMTELAIKPAPFFNNEDVMQYTTILAVYNENGVDLIDA